MTNKVAIQGIEGSFHHQVAQEFYGNQVQVEKCRSFSDVVRSLLSGQSSEAVMAIENSIAGCILPNYTLIDEHNLRIRGEHYLSIDLNLLALPGQVTSEINKVYSHPMALLQCKNFFNQHPDMRLIEDTDTAGAARRVAESRTPGEAAIASRQAAEIFGLQVLEPGIHSLKTNSTRFLILSAHQEAEQGNKASLRFELKNKQGSLSEVLGVVRDYGLDMTKIQSLPSPEGPWKYAFFLDVVFQEELVFLEAVEKIKELTEKIKVLGVYAKNLQ